jgi:transposase
MISIEIRQSVQTLHQQGLAVREISRLLKRSRNTIRRLLRSPVLADARVPACPAPVLLWLPPAFERVRGNGVRIQEMLQAELGLNPGYSTLTRWIREAGLRSPPRRSGEYVFAPGQEMQHDTSPHRVILAGKPVMTQCASLILAYSRYLFIQYYPRFTRFEAKQFLLEAARFLAGCCPTCIIDNTSVMVVAGAGDEAVFAPEMVAFARTLGFAFRAHPVNQPDRKGRVERPFAWVEGNFLAGRTFADFADLNQQALAWCEKVANAKPKRVLGMAPSAAYAVERPCLQPLPAVLPPVYQVAERVVDLYGFVSVETNRYSVPERWVGKTLTVYLYASELRICAREQLVAIHPRLIGVRDTKQKLPGHHPTPQRRDRTPPPEATLLQGHHPVLDAYVAALVKQAHGRGVRPLRRLLGFRRSYPESPFLAAVVQALQFGLFDLGRLEAMILQQVAGDFFHLDEGDDDA